MKKNVRFLTSGEVAERVNLPRWRLLYLIEKGDLPAPTCHVPGRRLFTEADVEQIQAVLDLEKHGTAGDADSPADGPDRGWNPGPAADGSRRPLDNGTD